MSDGNVEYLTRDLKNSKLSYLSQISICRSKYKNLEPNSIVSDFEKIFNQPFFDVFSILVCRGFILDKINNM